jgi:hypothetical protein
VDVIRLFHKGQKLMSSSGGLLALPYAMAVLFLFVITVRVRQIRERMFKIPSLVIANRNEDDPDENDDEELLSGG